MRKIKFKNIVSIILVFQFWACMSAGTHGSIEAYTYPIQKQQLKETVERVIKENNNLHRDTSKNYIINITNGHEDTLMNNRYNDGVNYVTFKIDNGSSEGYEYVIQYSTEEKKSKMASISIAYAYDDEGNGGSAGNGKVSWQNPYLRKKLLSLFENQFISKIDQSLNIKHIKDE